MSILLSYGIHHVEDVANRRKVLLSYPRCARRMGYEMIVRHNGEVPFVHVLYMALYMFMVIYVTNTYSIIMYNPEMFALSIFENKKLLTSQLTIYSTVQNVTTC